MKYTDPAEAHAERFASLARDLSRFADTANLSIILVGSMPVEEKILLAAPPKEDWGASRRPPRSHGPRAMAHLWPSRTRRPCLSTVPVLPLTQSS
eukprot:7377339-Prymnesium_polylepis.1